MHYELGFKIKARLVKSVKHKKQLFSVTRNVNNISQIRSTIKHNLKKKDRQKKNVECQSSRMKKDKCAVQDTERSQCRRTGIFIVTSEHISHLVLMFFLLTLNM